MRLASYNMRGRPSFGAVVGEGIVDLRSRLSRFATLLDVFRAQALDEAKSTAAGVRPDVPFGEVELLSPLFAPEKILCIGINYANRGADYNVTNNPKYPSMFYRAPNSMVGSGRKLVRPKISEQLDYEGEIAIVIGRDCKHVPKEQALRDRRHHARQRRHHPRLDAARPVQRHPGQEFRRHRRHRAVDRDRLDPTKPLHLTVRKNGEVTQDDTTASMIFSFADIIAYTTSFMTLKAGDVICTGTPVKKGPKSIRRCGSSPATPSRSSARRSASCATPWWMRRDRAVRAACIIGWPVEHSRSPLIHNYWLKTYGIAGEYRSEAVPPDQFEAFVQSLAARGYVGANVTVPHKEEALAFSLPDERAARSAPPTRCGSPAAFAATNTDVEGFLNNLDACAPHGIAGLTTWSWSAPAARRTRSSTRC